MSGSFYNFCSRGPKGWHCTRHGGHEGPCALVPGWWERAKMTFERWWFGGR